MLRVSKRTIPLSVSSQPATHSLMRKIITTLVALAAPFAVAACSTDPGPSLEDQASEICQSAVADKMKDPSSAQFRNITVSDPIDTTSNFANENGSREENVPGQYWKVSGEVNAKNGFGGMAGFSTFKCEAEVYEGRDMRSGYIDIDDR